MASKTYPNGPKYPSITVQLTGTDGNAMMVIGKVRAELRRHGLTDRDITEFTREAQSGDYDNVLATCMRWVHVS